MMRAHSYKSGEILANIGTVEMGVFQGLVGLLWRHMLKERWTVEDYLFVVRQDMGPSFASDATAPPLSHTDLLQIRVD